MDRAFRFIESLRPLINIRDMPLCIPTPTRSKSARFNWRVLMKSWRFMASSCLVQIEVEIEGLIVTVCGIVTVIGVVPTKVT